MDKDNFSLQKEKQLGREDRSDEGKWDRAIERLCNSINKKDYYYTTSSCSGRIAIVRGIPEKAENVFLFKTHNKITFGKLKSVLEKIAKNNKEIIYFKQEPAILHVAAKNIDRAKEILQTAIDSGWKRIGMLVGKKRILCELNSTEKLELPIIKNNKLLVTNDYLKLLLREANARLSRTRDKITRLEKEFS